MQIHPVVFTVRQELQRQLAATGSYVLAVSGGADSLALADACAWLQVQGWGRYTVCHVEHGLRGQEALADMQLVQDFCRERALACICCHVDAGGLAAKEHLSVEAAARELRYAALRRTAALVQAEYIVTAHHLDDQAETVLLRLLRGAGLDGLKGMLPRNGDVLRPFLQLQRSLLKQYCELQAIAYCRDSTNADVAYTRNRVRLELLPLLRQRFNPEAAQALARTARLLQEDAQCLEQLAAEAYVKIVRQEADGSLHMAAKELAQLPAALQSRIVRQAYFDLGGQELDYERSQALLELCRRGTGGKLVQLPGKITARYFQKQLILFKA